MAKYNLIDRETKEVVTIGDDNKVQFSGNWGEADEKGPLFIWVKNTENQD